MDRQGFALALLAFCSLSACHGPDTRAHNSPLRKIHHESTAPSREEERESWDEDEESEEDSDVDVASI